MAQTSRSQSERIQLTTKHSSADTDTSIWLQFGVKTPDLFF